MHGLEAVSSPILWDVVEEHFAEAEFLFEQWELSSRSADYVLEEFISGPEARLEAHLDGLRVAGAPTLNRLVLPTLADTDAEPHQLLVALLTLLSVGEYPDNFRCVLDLLSAESREHRQTAFQALLLTERPECNSTLWSQPRSPHVMRVLGFRGEDPGAEYACSLLQSEKPASVSVGLELVSLFGHSASCPWVERLMRSSSRELLANKLLPAAAVLQLPGWSDFAAEKFAELPLLGPKNIGDLEERTINQLATAPAEALWGLGFVGTKKAVDAAVPFLENSDERLQRLAAEVVRAVTDLNPEDDNFHRDPSEPTEDETLPDFADDDLDANLEEDPVDGLPLPQPDKYSEYWEKYRCKLRPKVRYTHGEIQCQESLLKSLDRISMRRRHAVAYQLRVLSQARIVVPTWKWGYQQRRSNNVAMPEKS